MANNLRLSDSARQNLTERFEGCKLVAYQDQRGVWTIGYGHTAHVYAGQTCTQQQADVWLEQDVASAENTVNRLVWITLTQGEFDALVDFTLNVGSGNFANSTLHELLNEGKIADAANEFAKWDYVNGVEVAGLLRRRLAEKQVFQS